MSNIPSYETPARLRSNGPPRTSTLAIAAMVLGLLSFCLTIFTALPAIVLGIIAVMKINKNPERYSGLGMAITGITTGAVGGLLMTPVMIAVLLPGIGESRERANRAACSANLTGLVKSMVIYAQDNGDYFPVTPPPARVGGFATATGIVGTQTDLDKALLEMGDPTASTYGSTRANVLNPLWMLVLRGQVAPKELMCKSDPVANRPSPLTDSSGHYFLTPESHRTVSYSIDYPYAGTSVGGWWRNNIQSDLPIVSDMAPMVGTGSPARHPAALSVADAGSRRQWNSDNHGGDGQEVAFGDAHVEWDPKPTVGTIQLSLSSMKDSAGNKVDTADNIWATWNGGSQALPPTGALTPPGDFHRPYDVIMVPARNVSDGTLSGGGGNN